MPDHDVDPPGVASSEVDHDTTPPANKGLLAIAGILLVIPIIALMWVSSYSRETPTLAGFPFFIWYQFLWVFLCSLFTYIAYLLVLKARPHRPMTSGASGTAIGDAADRNAFDGDLGNDDIAGGTK